MRIDFVHCMACCLPSSPSGRRVYVDGMEARGVAVARVCADVAHMRKIAATWAPVVPVRPSTAVLLGEAMRLPQRIDLLALASSPVVG